MLAPATSHAQSGTDQRCLHARFCMSKYSEDSRLTVTLCVKAEALTICIYTDRSGPLLASCRVADPACAGSLSVCPDGRRKQLFSLRCNGKTVDRSRGWNVSDLLGVVTGLGLLHHHCLKNSRPEEAQLRFCRVETQDSKPRLSSNSQDLQRLAASRPEVGSNFSAAVSSS